MEYDKHIKRLVLGYLKSECKAAYKIFFKSHFQNESRHVATRVAGQTLEDILKVYSRIQDVVQGRLEDTDYYKEYGSEVSSPTYLVEQLLYLLERDRPLTPTSTIRERSPVGSTVNEIYQNEENPTRITDIETTPEYSLPGNMLSGDEHCKSTTPFRRYSPVFRTPFLQQLPSSEQHNISSTVSKKLLRNRELPIKLAHSINTAYSSRKKELTVSQPSAIEYEETVIKNVMNKTEADPMFEELLDDLLGAVGSTLERAMGPTVAGSSSSTRTESPSPLNNAPDVREPLPFGAAMERTTTQNYSSQLEPQIVETPTEQQTKTFEPLESMNGQELIEPISNNEALACQEQNSPVKPAVNIQSQVILQPAAEDLVTTNTSSQCSMQPPQLIIVNQPLVIPQPLSVLQSVSSILQPNGKGGSFSGVVTAQDIMQASVVLNDIPADDDGTAASIPSRMDSADAPETKKSTPSENKIPPQESTKPRSLGSICTPSPTFPTVTKPTPKGSSHVRNLTFPSPIRKTNEKIEQNSPTAGNKQQASKDLFREIVENENNTKTNIRVEDLKPKNLKKKQGSKSSQKTEMHRKGVPLRKSPRKVEKQESSVAPLKKSSGLWDSDLRILATTGNPDEVVTTPGRKTTSRKRVRKSESESLDAEAKQLEDALKTPAKPQANTKQKTLSSKRKTVKEKAAKVKAEKALSQIDEKVNEDLVVVTACVKKVLSPSKVYNTASKRNMDVDGITPKNPREVSTQLVSNARKNITGLLVTPLKDDEVSPNVNITKDTPLDTPFTPMLKANLREYALGDNFAIDTPNFPITPGMSLMEHPTPSYCILNDTETNKATEAIVLSEEKKSSVRKTDDEDAVLISPKVYGTTEILEEFNKCRVGQKNLELLGNKVVHWESDIEEDNSSTSISNEESNGTVIRNRSVRKDEPGSTKTVRSAGKSMSMLKAQILNSSVNNSVCFDESTDKIKQEPPPIEESGPPPIEAKSLNQNAENTGSSGESEITSKDTYKQRISAEKEQNSQSKSESPVVRTKTAKTIKPKKQKTNSSKALVSSDKAGLSKESVLPDAQTELSKDSPNSNAQTSPGKCIKDGFLSEILSNNSYHLTSEFSVKAEIEEKRKRMIELDKVMLSQASKTPSRRRSGKLTPRPSLSGQSSRKRKKSSPKRLVKRVAKRKTETPSEDSNSDSQDEFFKQSGSNLHRTNKQVWRSSERLKAKNNHLENNTNEEVKVEDQNCDLEVVNQNNLQTAKDKNCIIANTSENQTVAEEHSSLWEDCVVELQPCEISVVYDPKNSSKKTFKDYDLTLLSKAIQLDVPLADGTDQTVQIWATPFKTLWEIAPMANVRTSVNKSDDCNHSNECMRSLLESNSDSEHGAKFSDTNECKSSKKRKHRSDSCSSNSSKKLKAQLPPKCLDNSNIENLLTRLHGPSEKP